MLVWGGVWRHLKFVQDEQKPDVSCFRNLHPSSKSWFSKEADPLTTLFIKARCMAFVDVPNLFALPQPNMDKLVPVEEVDKYTKQEYTTRLMEAHSCLLLFLYWWSMWLWKYICWLCKLFCLVLSCLVLSCLVLSWKSLARFCDWISSDSEIHQVHPIVFWNDTCT